MLFNTSKNYDFQPEMKIDGVRIEAVKQMRLLGVIITYDLKWPANTANITKKASKDSRTWVQVKKLQQKFTTNK